jgi:LuxR family transcriptional regulator, maltose regulon positive regulatory protein
MSMPVLVTKLFVPPPRPKLVQRARLSERLNEVFRHKLTLLSAPAGYGKTTLVSDWLADCKQPSAWLTLDEGDNDPTRFLAYVVAAIQTVSADFGTEVVGMLLSPQPAPPDTILLALLNEIATIGDQFVLVLDDYHVIDAKPVEHALTFLLEHQPPQMHLVVATRDDPQLPLARLRVGGHLAELRVADLRFTTAESTEFLNGVMGLTLSAQEIAALDGRTEGWIAGLQLAAISMRGQNDATSFISSFTGSHHFVLDYLVEEVLHQQPEHVQTFLLRTSMLDRMCGPLCDAILLAPVGSAQETLEYLEHANLFIVPLDNERRWYRYHHLFAELLRQRLQLSVTSSPDHRVGDVADLHRRASQWYEHESLELEAFHHAAAAHDMASAERLIEGEGVPLYFRGAGAPVLRWLESLPMAALNARPSLWLTYASALMTNGQHTAVEQKLQGAEKALQGADLDEKTQDLVGRIASMRATLAIIQHEVEEIITQSRRALEYLDPNNLPARTAANWTLGYAYQLQGDRAAASRAYADVIAISRSFAHSIYTTAATLSLGQVQEMENLLDLAAENYRRVLQIAGDPPHPIACEAFVGLARITYQWNDLDTAEQYAQQCLQLTRQMESLETFASYKLFFARLQLTLGDVPGAVAVMDGAEAFVRQQNFLHRMPEIAAAQVLTLLQQGHLAAAAQLAQAHILPMSQARVYLAQGDAAAALATLSPWLQQMEAKGWADERLKVLVLQAVALQANGDTDTAVQVLGEALTIASPGRFIRLFVDEGLPMARLLSEAAARGMMPDYVGKLLAVFEADKPEGNEKPYLRPATSAQPLIEPLTRREVEILHLIAQGLSNQEICQRLFLAMSTVKGHNRIIFDKLQVQRRTEAVARARELDLL